MNQSIISSFFLFSWAVMLNILLTLLLYPNLSIMHFLISMIIFSLLTALNLTKFSKMSLLSYLTFLMMTGGIMILFSFFISLISNNFSYSETYTLVFKYLLLYSAVFMMKFHTLNKDWMVNLKTNEEYLSYFKQFTLNNFLNLNSLFDHPKGLLILILMLFLLFSLIFITKIALNNSKALRMTKF